MIILPSEHLMILAQDHIKDFNREPAAGSESHVSDHKTIVDILLTIPNARIMYGQVWKDGGQWYKKIPGVLTNWSESGSPDGITPIDFDEVSRIGETPGTIYIAADPLDLADGVTDYKEDLFPDQIAFMVYSAGLFGLDQVVPELIQEVHSSRARLSTLESDSATLNTTVSQLGEDVTALSNANSTLEGQVSTLESDIGALTTASSTLEGKVSTLESDNSSLNTTVSTLESDNVSLNETVSGLETDFGSLSSANDTLSSTVSTLEGNVATLTSDKETLEGQVSTLESTIADLTSRLEALEAPTTPE